MGGQGALLSTFYMFEHFYKKGAGRGENGREEPLENLKIIENITGTGAVCNARLGKKSLHSVRLK